MAATSVKCPKCSSVLKSTRLIPPGALLKCPKCQTPFKTPAAEEDELVEPEVEDAPAPAVDDEVEEVDDIDEVEDEAPPKKRSRRDDEDDDDDRPRGKSGRSRDDDDLDDDDEPPRRKPKRGRDDDDDLDDEDDDRPRRKAKRDRDEDDEDERPARKKKKKKGGKGLLIGLIAGGGVLLVLIVGLLLFFLLGGGGSTNIVGNWQQKSVRSGKMSMNLGGDTNTWSFTKDGEFLVGRPPDFTKIGTYRVSGGRLYITPEKGQHFSVGGMLDYAGEGVGVGIAVIGDELQLTSSEHGIDTTMTFKKR